MLWYNNIDYVWSEYEVRRRESENRFRRHMSRLARDSAKR